MRKQKRLAISFLLLFLLSGCLGKEEINDLALVMAVGIEKGEEENIKITAQIARPADIRGTAGGGGGGEPSFLATGEGKTIFEAIRDIAKYASRRVYWGHNMVIIVSEEVAKEGIVDVIDFFTRNNELRMRTWFVIAEEPGSLIPVKSGMEVLSGESIDKLFRYSPKVSQSPQTDVMSVTKGYQGEYIHPHAAIVSIEEAGGKSQINLEGTAIFREDKMVGKLDERESRGFLWFVGSIGTAIIPLTCPDEEGEVSIELRQNDFNIKPKYENGDVSFVVTISTEADLVELGCPTKKEQEEMMASLEPKVEEYIKENISRMLNKLQNEYSVDAIGLSRVFYAKYPQHWEHMKEEWDELFPNIKVDVNVSATIHNPQLFRTPTRPGKD